MPAPRRGCCEPPFKAWRHRNAIWLTLIDFIHPKQ